MASFQGSRLERVLYLHYGDGLIREVLAYTHRYVLIVKMWRVATYWMQRKGDKVVYLHNSACVDSWTVNTKTPKQRILSVSPQQPQGPVGGTGLPLILPPFWGQLECPD